VGHAEAMRMIAVHLNRQVDRTHDREALERRGGQVHVLVAKLDTDPRIADAIAGVVIRRAGGRRFLDERVDAVLEGVAVAAPGRPSSGWTRAYSPVESSLTAPVTVFSTRILVVRNMMLSSKSNR